MENFFTFLGYMLFGRHWVLWNMKHGLKTAIFVNEIEIDMQRDKLRTAQDGLTALESEKKGIQKKLDEKAYADEEEREALLARKAQIPDEVIRKQDEISGADGELQRIYNITYHNRLKYDFVKKYRMKRSYADRKD